MFGNDRGRDRYDIIRALSRVKNSFANDAAIESAPTPLGNAGYFAGIERTLQNGYGSSQTVPTARSSNALMREHRD